MSDKARAVLLAAGRGSRLGPLTGSAPKCLCPVSGWPLLAWQLESLAAAGVGETVLVTGYRSDRLAAYGDHRCHNGNWQDTNMVASLRCARAFLDRPVLVAYTDIVYAPSHVRALLTTEAPLAITVDTEWQRQWTARFQDPLADAESLRLDWHGRVREIGDRPKSVAEVEGQFMGLIRLTPAALGWVDAVIETVSDPGARANLDMTGLLSRIVRAGHPVQALKVAGAWAEVDSPDDIAYAERVVVEAGLPRPAK